MLVLTRRVGESIMIGPDVEVKILKYTKWNGEINQVKFGISAPDDVKIHRKEVVERMERENGQE